MSNYDPVGVTKDMMRLMRGEGRSRSARARHGSYWTVIGRMQEKGLICPNYRLTEKGFMTAFANDVKWRFSPEGRQAVQNNGAPLFGDTGWPPYGGY